MSEHYPRIRIFSPGGYLAIREGLTLTFYMRHDHTDVAPAVLQALETYRRAIAPHVLGQYSYEGGQWVRLDESGWEGIRQEMLDGSSVIFDLKETPGSEHRYRFVYFGRLPEHPNLMFGPRSVSAVSFWLSTEFLEAHGPERVRELALELASRLPFCSGFTSLSFNCETDVLGVEEKVRKLCFRYPGMDIPEPDLCSWEIGTRVRGISWLNFLGQPVLGELGGAAGLRARLHSPGTTVQEMEGERAVVTLGPWPEAGDTEQGRTLPAYRELARALEPWLYHEESRHEHLQVPEHVRRWERRFLD